MALAAAEMATMGGGAMMGELGRAREDGAAGESGEGEGEERRPYRAMTRRKPTRFLAFSRPSADGPRCCRPRTME
jgi:hypothetical protein